MFCWIDALGSQRCALADRQRSRTHTAGLYTPVRCRLSKWRAAALRAGQSDVRTTRQRDLNAKWSQVRSAKDTDVGTPVLEEMSRGQVEIHLQELLDQLKDCASYESKIDVLMVCGECQSFLHTHGDWFREATEGLDAECVFVLLCVIAIGQQHVFVNEQRDSVLYATSELCHQLSKNLIKVETFYNSLGGLLGYQLKSLQLLSKSAASNMTEEAKMNYLMPCFMDLSKETADVKDAVRAGIEAVPYMCEIYALGGSGDRLGLRCPDSGDLLPSAMLPYCGRSMLDSMIRDLQARESLYFKLTGEQHVTPIAIMTSDAKDNDTRIKAMLRSQDWYGRGKAAFFIFKQPLVPLLDISNGAWLVSAPGKIVMRPGGHGVIWKLMWDEGVFNWLKSMHRKAAILRQVSNPLAATDTTILALSGVGISQDKSMGFASCERVVGASEGMNVVQHRYLPQADGEMHEYGITNIEYTEFERLGLTDVAVHHNSSTSRFPANTNILYVSLNAAEKAVERGIEGGGFGACLPGLIFNMKKRVSYKDEMGGGVKKCLAGRMECMMQNLADSLADSFGTPLNPDALTVEHLSTFMVSNVRRKVTSSAKKKYKPSGSLRQTPEGSFWDLLLNAREILQHCGMTMPEMGSVEEYLHRGPRFIFLFHPALGPLWSIIAQKLRDGEMKQGSELVLEVAEARIQNLTLDGSLIILAEDVVGQLSQPLHSPAETDGVGHPHHGLLQYSSHVGRIQLENVRVENAGIDWAHHENIYWKHQVYRESFCMIRLHGCAEFSAKDVVITGDRAFKVPDRHRLSLIPDPTTSDGYRQELTEIADREPSWEWQYGFDGDDVSLTWFAAVSAMFQRKTEFCHSNGRTSFLNVARFNKGGVSDQRSTLRQSGRMSARYLSRYSDRRIGCVARASSTKKEAEEQPANRLIDAQSPDLVSYANDLVDWYPWGEEAFEKARSEGKLVFLSVGYQSCHWCHVMEKESFNDPQMARLVNENFVPVKVDREEHPDVDKLYALFLQGSIGFSGWPLNVFLTPDLNPVLGMTYAPTPAKNNIPSFQEVITEVLNGWRQDKESVHDAVHPCQHC